MGAGSARIAWLLLIWCLPGYLAPVAAAGDWQLYDFTDDGGVYAWRYLPDGGVQPVPVVVFFHGSGSAPEPWMPILQPVADELGVALLVPRSDEFLTFLPGADDVTVERALARLATEVELDPRRLSLAGHSAGGGHALVMAYGRAFGINAVFVLGTPYRTVLGVADPDHTPTVRMYYGRNDPNYSASRLALEQQWDHLGIDWTPHYVSGYGHSDWPPGTLEDGLQFLLDHPYATAGGCFPDATTLCLRGGAYEVTATWADFQGDTGGARVASARTAESGLLTFFSDSNWELQVKVLDGCAVNGHVWVFAAGTTNVEFQLRVRHVASDQTRGYDNPLGNAPAPIFDIEAFDCP